MASNGNIPTSQMRRVDGWAWLAPGAAAAWLLFAFYVTMHTNIRPTITQPDGAYRNIARQIYWRIRKGAGAAIPGRSNHGLGMAVDVGNYRSFNHAWLKAAAERYNFRFDVNSENWHIHYLGAANYGASTTTASTGTTPLPAPTIGDDMAFIRSRKNRPAGDNSYAGMLSTPEGIVQTFDFESKTPGSPASLAFLAAQATHPPIVEVTGAVYNQEKANAAARLALYKAAIKA